MNTFDPRFKHKEAFCLMKYASADGLMVEWLWNSRDGVTPFCLKSRDGQAELTHVEWLLDRCLPKYSPLPGERIFVDYTPEAARAEAARLVEQYWDDERFPMWVQYESREAAEETMFRSGMEEVRRGDPMVILARDWKQPAPPSGIRP